MIKCKACECAKYVKSGTVRWIQRYKCKLCWCNFTDTDKRWVDDKTKKLALILYLEWLWFRAIARIIWYSNVSVLNRIRWLWAIADKYHEEARKHVKLTECELDEVRHFVKKNETNCDYGLFVRDSKQRLLILN